jgi:hypothetical protein
MSLSRILTSSYFGIQCIFPRLAGYGTLLILGVASSTARAADQPGKSALETDPQGMGGCHAPGQPQWLGPRSLQGGSKNHAPTMARR